MHIWTFHPPNYQSLSANVIGNVTQRARSSREGGFFNTKQEERAASRHLDLRGARLLPFKECPPISSHTQGDISPTTTDWLNPSTTRKRSRSLQDTDDIVATQEPVPRVIPDHQRTMSVRERRRLKQIRYRTKKRRLLLEYEVEIPRLRDEIQDLEERRHNYSFTRTVWDVATEYFHLFRHGTVPESLRSYTERFLQQSICDHESLRKTWERFSIYFDCFDVRLQRLDKIGDDLLLATTTTSFAIPDKALRQLFTRNTNKKDDSELAAKLLN
ncbi:hypothetical protein L914_19979 [Phytophthora nicotianae]|uniref:BZIP domain-containing protein n=1 Tax=Phytophthora nicotianae TaxID=4792 RepID=W2M8G1_PHYNI|nr:hypothetical protein L914_19979 [Phytophthora nicotianae]